jgi:hypothetical protein
MSLSKLVAFVALVASLTLPANVKATTFTDNFSPPSTLWSNSIGNLDGWQRDLLCSIPEQRSRDLFGSTF